MDRKRWHEIVSGDDPQWGRTALMVEQGFVVLALVFFSISTLPDFETGWVHLVNILLAVYFLAEYLLRLWSAPSRVQYAFSFWGFVDLMSFLPSLLIFLPFDGQAMRAFRLFTLFRLLKLGRHEAATRRLKAAFDSVRSEFVVAILMTMIVLYIAAVGIWVFEHDAQPEAFGSVFHALWWALSTLTTVGYGDVYPVTTGGRVFTGVVLMIGLAVVAIPTGLVAAALTNDRLEELEGHVEGLEHQAERKEARSEKRASDTD